MLSILAVRCFLTVLVNSQETNKCARKVEPLNLYFLPSSVDSKNLEAMMYPR